MTTSGTNPAAPSTAASSCASRGKSASRTTGTAEGDGDSSVIETQPCRFYRGAQRWPFARMSTAPQLSIIVVSQNSSARLQTALESLTQQRMVQPEIIVVDRGSTDGSR